jgi:hypothetical protein
MLSQQDIKELQKIFYEELGIRLTEQETHEHGNKLVDIYRVIYRPIPRGSPKAHELDSN